MREPASAKPDDGNEYEAAHCEACGQPFWKRIGKRGRPQVYCTKKCSKILEVQDWLFNMILDEDFSPTRERAIRLRQSLWQMGNELNQYINTKHHEKK